MLDLTGLTPAPAQVWATVRLVPLIRTTPSEGALRLKLRSYTQQAAWTDVKLNDSIHYGSTFVPHAMIVDWTQDGSPVAAWRTGIELDGPHEGRHTRQLAPGCAVRELHRMIRREDKERLRFLPMHLALEGLMSLHFGGPDVAWSEWSYQAMREGLNPVWETTLRGQTIPALDEALRLFELHPNQCGVLVLVAETLATAFIAPHPEDYRLMHDAIVQDMFAELFWHLGALDYDAPPFQLDLGEQRVTDLADLSRRFELERQRWANVELSFGRDLVGRAITRKRLYDIGPGPRYTLETFMTNLDTDDAEHVGECILDASGALQYLKTLRLTRQQVRRARLLSLLSQHGWHLPSVEAALHKPPGWGVRELERVGLGYLLRAHLRC
jgi:hypothetical protein